MRSGVEVGSLSCEVVAGVETWIGNATKQVEGDATLYLYFNRAITSLDNVLSLVWPPCSNAFGVASE